LNRALALLPILCLVVACRTPLLAGSPLSPDDPRPAFLMGALQERATARHALRATAKLELDAPDLRLSRPQRMAVERPARLRLEILGLFDQLAAVLVTNGEVYQLYDARKGDIEEGLVTAGLLWRVARVDLVPEEAVDLILGVPTPRRGLSLGSARVFEDGAIEVDQVTDEGALAQRLRFNASGQLDSLETRLPSGKLLWRARFADYRAVPSTARSGLGELDEAAVQDAFAFDVRLDFPGEEAEVRLRFKKVALEPGLPDALFELKLGGRSVTRPLAPGAAGAQH
jgi:hypothetical protein